MSIFFTQEDLVKVAKLAAGEPTKGNLIVGSVGVDHSGPNHDDREYTVLSINGVDRAGFYPTSKPQSGDRITIRYNDTGEEKGMQSLQFKQTMHDEIMTDRLRAIKVKKNPGWLDELTITWDAEGGMAWFIGWLAGNRVKLFSDAPDRNINALENKYQSLTGRTPAGQFKQPPADSVAEAERYGARAIITFTPTDHIPDEIARAVHDG